MPFKTQEFNNRIKIVNSCEYRRGDRITKINLLSYKCHHCGQCCINEATQINLTAGDIVRLSSHNKIKISGLFKEHISINPFPTENPDVYELDLGLNIPCKFWSSQKENCCNSYYARPLNCRLFPFWIFTALPEKEANEAITKCHKCKGTKLNKEEREIYTRYCNMIKALLLNEARLTDEMMKDLGLNKQIDITKIKGYSLLQKQVSGMDDKEEKEKIKIRFIKEHLEGKYNNLGKQIEEEIIKRKLDKRIMPLHEIQFAENVLKLIKTT